MRCSKKEWRKQCGGEGRGIERANSQTPPGKLQTDDWFTYFSTALHAAEVLIKKLSLHGAAPIRSVLESVVRRGGSDIFSTPWKLSTRPSSLDPLGYCRKLFFHKRRTRTYTRLMRNARRRTSAYASILMWARVCVLDVNPSIADFDSDVAGTALVWQVDCGVLPIAERWAEGWQAEVAIAVAQVSSHIVYGVWVNRVNVAPQTNERAINFSQLCAHFETKMIPLKLELKSQL